MKTWRLMNDSAMSRRDLIRWGLAATLGMPAVAAFAQTDLPKGPIMMIVPFASGGATDIVTRLIAQKLSMRIGRPVVVENAAGGGGTIGAIKVAKAVADGNVLLMGTVATHAINPLTTPPAPYDPVRDFTPISLIAKVPNVLLVSASVEAKNLGELIELLKANPGRYNYGSSGVGTPPHLSGELFKAMAKVDISHVPYRGGGPAMADLVGGHIPILFDVLSGAASHIRAGSVRALVVTTAERSPSFPDLPTMAESGLPGYETYTWNAVFGPAGVPAPIVGSLSRALQEVVAEPDVQARLMDLSAMPVGSSPEGLSTLVRTDLDKLGALIKSIGGLQKD